MLFIDNPEQTFKSQYIFIAVPVRVSGFPQLTNFRVTSQRIALNAITIESATKTYHNLLRTKTNNFNESKRII
jgi:hypothetical protein